MNQKNQHSFGLNDPSGLLPGQSIDCVIVGYDLHLLHILIIKWKKIERWLLPGGFINLDEDLDSAAIRILEERTGLKLPFLHQFHTFGNVNRRNTALLTEQMAAMKLEDSEFNQWLSNRFISTGYLSLVNMRNSKPTPDFFSDICQWKPLNALPELILDHQHIVNKALDQIREQINYLPIGINLLSEKFTMKDLQILYESILQKVLDRANFQKKMLKLEFLKRLEKQNTGGAHKAPYLYSFDKEKYDQLLEKGIGFIG